MPTLTSRMLLVKPTTAETADIAVINANMDEVDQNMGARVVTSVTRPTGTDRFTGQQIYETDTGLIRMYDGTNWLIVGPTLAPLTAVFTGDKLATGSTRGTIAVPSTPCAQIIIVNALGMAGFDAADRIVGIDIGATGAGVVVESDSRRDVRAHAGQWATVLRSAKVTVPINTASTITAVQQSDADVFMDGNLHLIRYAA